MGIWSNRASGWGFGLAGGDEKYSRPIFSPRDPRQSSLLIREPFLPTMISALLRGAEPDESQLKLKLGEKNFALFRALSRETDPEIFYESLLSFGQSLEDAGKAELASEIYSAVVSAPPGEGSLPKIANRAQGRLDALAGSGQSNLRTEILLKNFTEMATDYRTIAPMLAGSVIYQVGRAAALRSLVSISKATRLTRGFGARTAASAFGAGLEIPAFTMMGRGLREWSGAEIDASPWPDLASGALTLSALKLSAAAGAGIRLPQFTSFLGLLAAHQVEIALGFKPHVDWARALTDTFATFTGLSVGAHLGHRLLGPKIFGFNRELKMRSDMGLIQPPAQEWRLKSADSKKTNADLITISSKAAESREAPANQGKSEGLAMEYPQGGPSWKYSGTRDLAALLSPDLFVQQVFASRKDVAMLEGWALDEAGNHFYENPRALSLSDQSSVFSEKKYGKWRILKLRHEKGKSFLLLQSRDVGSASKSLIFETSVFLRRTMKEDGKIYLEGEGISLPLEADCYFYSEISGGTGGSGFAFGRLLDGKGEQGVLLKDFSGWKGRFRLFQVESRQRDWQDNDVLILKPSHPSVGTAVNFQVQAGDGEKAYTGWQTGDYVFFIPAGAKGLAAKPGKKTKSDAFFVVYQAWRDAQDLAAKSRISQKLFGNRTEAVRTNAIIPRPTVLRDTEGRDFELRTRSLYEAQAGDAYPAIFLGAEPPQGEDYRRASEYRLIFGFIESIEDYRFIMDRGFPRRQLTFAATLEEARRLGFEFDEAGKLFSQTREKNWLLTERKNSPGAAVPESNPEGSTPRDGILVETPISEGLAPVHGEFFMDETAPDPEVARIKEEYKLYTPGEPPGRTVVLGRGSVGQAVGGDFISVPDPVIRRRHLFMKRGADGEVEIRAIPPAKDSADWARRRTLWVESGGEWLPLPAGLPYVLKPNDRFALGPVHLASRDASQALVFRLSPDGNSLLLN